MDVVKHVHIGGLIDSAVKIPVCRRDSRVKVAMYDFHVRLGIEAHPVHDHPTRQRDSRWRFASLTDAEKFARQFGGSVVPDDSGADRPQESPAHQRRG